MSNLIRLGISTQFMNKENQAALKPDREGKPSNLWAYAAFNAVEWSPEQIVKHITGGRAICIAACKNGYRRGDYFESAQIMGVDFDNGPDITGLMLKDLVYEHAFLAYATPSSTPEAPRSRSLFILDAPISDPVEYKRLLKRLLLAFDAEDIDGQCKDTVRIFYGSAGKRFSDVSSARLPIEVLLKLPPHPDESKVERETRDATAITDLETRKRAESWALKTKQNIFDEAMRHAPANQGGHEALNFAGMKLVAKAKGGWPGFESVDADLRWLGLQMNRQEDEIARSIRGAWDKAVAEPLALPSDEAAQPARETFQIAPETPTVNAGAPPVLPNWHTSVESMQRYRERLKSPRTDGRLPLAFPFHALHEFGGFCRVLAPGVMVGVVGLSGGMKTSFVETITDAWKRAAANDVLWYGPEWSWEKMGDRAVQRYGGANMTDVLLHELYFQEQDRPLQLREGVKLPQAVYERSLCISEEMERWPGMNHYIDQMDLDIGDLLDASAQRLTDAKNMGRNIKIAVWDYLQLMDMRSARSEQDRITQILGRLKAFCVDYGLIGIVASQVTKSASAENKDNQKLLTSEAGQFFRGDKFNLVLTLNPIFDGKLLTDKGVISVDKNSIGRTGAVEVFIKPSQLKWIDTEDQRL